jgi:hypothetical protein
MSKFIAFNMVQADTREGVFNEDTGRTEYPETGKPVVINAETIRCFYARRDGKPGTRITFSDGGGFAVTEAPDVVALAVAGGELADRLALAVQPVATETVS